ncbi:MAG TPA: hypothetical protein VMV38_01390 [Candidatus Paceibacterota bacterium]|nr:hypothetical protein [Candidatus Paceibacterota bacterium]
MEPRPLTSHPKFVRWALMLGIMVILNVFFSAVLALAYPAPTYEDFCPTQPAKTLPNAATCDAQGGVWTEYPSAPTGQVNPATGDGSLPGYCDMTAKCQVPYQAAQDQHALYAFIILTSFGIIALVAGLIPLGSSIVSSGLSYGGVLALLIASAQYWGTAGNWIRLLITTMGLVALLYIGWRRFRD